MGAPTSADHNEGGHRADIQGLRAVAVVAVVLYHGRVPLLGGGYTGVDVFFVISGYLITRLLWSELEKTGRVRFAAFYGRRARRLLPMSMLVVALTMAAAAAVLPPLEVRTVWKDGAATALYWANYRFAALNTSYLSTATPPSPFQQYWSLGVEEQFYLFWPLLLVLAASPLWRWHQHRQAARRSPEGPSAPVPTGSTYYNAPSRLRAFCILGTLACASFGLSYWLTTVDQPWAFFSLPTRAWELSAGGLVALAAPTLLRLPAAGLAIAGWAGLGAIVAAAVMFGANTSFPGTAALQPVLGATAVLAGGLKACAWGPVALLGRRPLQLGGDISYSWYLWHWPAMVLVPYLTDHPLTLAEGLELAAGSGAIAVLSYMAVEQPARRSAWLAKRPWRSISVGATLSVAGVLTCVVATWSLPTLRGHGVAPVAAAPAPAQGLQQAAAPKVSFPAQATQRPSATSAGEPEAAISRSGIASRPSTKPAGGGGEPPAPRPRRRLGSPGGQGPAAAVEARLIAQEHEVASVVTRSARTKYLPSNLDPPLGDVTSSEAPPFLDGCLQGFTGTSLLPCEFADTSSPRTVVLFGDSHATMWFPALYEIAQAFHWKLVVWTKATCPPVEISLFSPDLGAPYTQCQQWRAEVMARVAAIRPLLVVIGIAPNYDSAYDVRQDGPAWMAGLARTIKSLRRSAAHVLVMGPVESPDTVVPDCLSAHPDDVPACDVTPKETHVGIGLVGYDNAGLAVEQRVVEHAGAWFANLKGWFCAPTSCPVIIGNIVVFRDNSHITVQYADYLEPLVASEVELALLRA